MKLLSYWLAVALLLSLPASSSATTDELKGISEVCLTVTDDSSDSGELRKLVIKRLSEVHIKVSDSSQCRMTLDCASDHVTLSLSEALVLPQNPSTKINADLWKESKPLALTDKPLTVAADLCDKFSLDFLKSNISSHGTAAEQSTTQVSGAPKLSSATRYSNTSQTSIPGSQSLEKLSATSRSRIEAQLAQSWSSSGHGQSKMSCSIWFRINDSMTKLWEVYHSSGDADFDKAALTLTKDRAPLIVDDIDAKLPLLAKFDSERVTIEEAPLVDYAAYMKRLDKIVKAFWAPPTSSRELHAEVLFDVTKDGNISNARMHKPSGDEAFDQAALDALNKVTKSKRGIPLPENSRDKVIINFGFDSHPKNSIHAAPTPHR